MLGLRKKVPQSTALWHSRCFELKDIGRTQKEHVSGLFLSFFFLLSYLPQGKPQKLVIFFPRWVIDTRTPSSKATLISGNITLAFSHLSVQEMAIKKFSSSCLMANHKTLFQSSPAPQMGRRNAAQSSRIGIGRASPLHLSPLSPTLFSNHISTGPSMLQQP